MMAPANGFYSSENAGKNEVRIAYVLNQDSLKKSVECLRHALEQYPERIQ
jgi:aspartate aminotransferase